MKETIETLREKLNQLTKDDVCLYSEEVLKLSCELDKQIHKYYKNIMNIGCN